MITIKTQRGRRWLLAATALAAALLLFVLGRATSPGTEAADSSAGAAGEHEHEGEEQLYYCSMHPDQQSTDPNATCPICGMDMVPMPDDSGEDGDAPVLRMSDRAAALARVEVAPVARRDTSSQMHFQGHVELDETRITDVVARSDGFVERQHADYKWQSVRRGQALAEIYSPTVTAAARELLVLSRGREGRGGGLTIDSGREKLRRLGAPAGYIQRVLDSGQVPRTYALRSPVSGVVTEIEGSEGFALKEGQRLVRIADLSRVWVQLQAYESDLPTLRVGQTVEVTTRAHPGENFEGKVAFIDPAVDASRRTVQVRLEVGNPDGQLKPGMFVRGAVRGGGQDEESGAAAAQAPLVIPATAPLLTGRTAIVYVRREGEVGPVYEGREIELGARMGDSYEVHAGLEEGELVVTRGAFRIDSELQIRGRPSMMAPGEHFGGGVDEGPGAALAALAPDDVPEGFATSAAELVRAYFDLNAALAADDLEGAQSAVQLMQERLAAVPAGELPGEAANGWRELEEELGLALGAMASASDLEGIRASLDRTAEPLERVAEAIEGKADLEVYRGTCPMTESGEGHWLQPTDEIANPYMGQKMLGCGTLDQVTP